MFPATREFNLRGFENLKHQRDEPQARGLALYTRVVDYLRIAELRPLLSVFFFLSLTILISFSKFHAQTGAGRVLFF